MKRIAVLLPALIGLLLSVVLVDSGSASAQVPDAPTTSCPGVHTGQAARMAMFCAANTPARAEGPYYVNYVAEVAGRQQFCISYRPTGTQTKLECHPYWPFFNPTVNAYLAPRSAFDSGRLVASEGTVKVLIAENDRQARKIARLKAKIAKLHHRHH